MIEYRKNNYFRPHGSGESFTIDIDPITRDIKSYKEELFNTAIELWDNKEGPMYCFYSGGIDSEIMLEVFRILKMDIKVVIVRMLPDLNRHDLIWAKEYCNKHNITPLFIDIVFHDFLHSDEMMKLALLAETGTVQYLSTMKAALSLDGTVICGNEEPYLTPNHAQGKWYYKETESWSGWRNLYKKGLLKGTSAFHSWTSESLLAFMMDPTIVELGNNRIPGKQGSFTSRVHVYNKISPIQSRTKYTGWESVERRGLFQHENIQAVLKLKEKYNGEFRMEYNTFINMMKGNILT